MNRHPFGLRAAVTTLSIGAVAVPIALAPTFAHAAKRSATRRTAGTTTATAAPTAHLRLKVTTSSDWTSVDLSDGRVVAPHVTSSSGTGTYAAHAGGVGLSGVSGTASVTVDVVLDAADGATAQDVRITKGYAGSTSVTVTNLNGSKAVSVGTFADTLHSSTDPTNAVTSSVSESRMMTTTPLAMPRADKRHLVLAFYYPWFASYDDSRFADRPSDPRSVWDQPGVDSMTRQAQANGINGFIVSYAGDASDGPGFDAARRAAERTGQVVTGYLETARATSESSAPNADPTVMRDWLVQLLKRQDSPAFLKADDGVPVVFVYGMARLQPRHWQAILANLRDVYGLQVHLVGDTLDPAYLPYEWGVHRYAVNDSAAALTGWSRTAELTARAPAVTGADSAPKAFVGTVSPGYDDTNLRGTTNPVVGRDGGARYDATWSAAEAGQPDWVAVTSWNEWFEGTSVEPGVANGDLALQQTAQHAAAFGG